LSEATEDFWVEVGRFRALRDAEQHALVLVASGVESRIVPAVGGMSLLVAAADAAKARSEIALYTHENRPRPHPTATLRPLREGMDAAFLYCTLLLLVDSAANRNVFGYDWLAIGDAQAGLIRSGEWWRAITALWLHADIGHLLSNMALGGLLGVLLAQLVGAGLAWLAILISGGVGNLVAAYLEPTEHAAIGASTAVFAALGLLAALAWGRQTLPWRRLRRWSPLAAAVMLLALVGVGGERTDVGGHIAGLFTGGFAGAMLHFAGARVLSGRRAQLTYGAAALAIFVGSWLAAFASS